MQNFQNTTPLAFTATLSNQEKIPGFAVCPYDEWTQTLISRQKRYPHPLLSQWMAEQIIKTLPLPGRRAALAWVPSKPYSAPHLVEGLLAPLAAMGLKPLSQNPLKRSFFASKAQKHKNLEERHNVKTLGYGVTKTYPSLPNSQPLVFLDDLATTGVTLQTCAQLLRSLYPTQPLTAVTFALTPRKFTCSDMEGHRLIKRAGC